MRSGGESACVRAVLLKSDGIRVSARSECGRYADLANGDGVFVFIVAEEFKKSDVEHQHEDFYE